MATSQNKKIKVFLCHFSEDKPIVQTLYKDLVLSGVDAWFDKENLLPGQEWEREIPKAVHSSDIILVCLSKKFNQRGYRQKEVRIALDEADMLPDGEIFIIPVRLEECEVPFRLRRWQWVDLFEENGSERLMQSLVLRAEGMGIKLGKQGKASSIGENIQRNIQKKEQKNIKEKCTNLLELKMYKDAYDECKRILMQNSFNAQANLFAAIALLEGRGADLLPDTRIKKAKSHLKRIRNSSYLYPLSLIVLGIIKYDCYFAHGEEDGEDSSLSFTEIKNKIIGTNIDFTEHSFLRYVTASKKALLALGIYDYSN